MRVIGAILLTLLTGCRADFGPDSKMRSSSEVVLTGWAHVRGEIMLFKTRKAMIERNYQECISGLPLKGSWLDFLKFEGQQVSVSGHILEYQSLPHEDEPVLQRKILNGRVISNFCLKDDVISISNVTAELR